MIFRRIGVAKEIIRVNRDPAINKEMAPPLLIAPIIREILAIHLFQIFLEQFAIRVRLIVSLIPMPKIGIEEKLSRLSLNLEIPQPPLSVPLVEKLIRII